MVVPGVVTSYPDISGIWVATGAVSRTVKNDLSPIVTDIWWFQG
jgi:hypothetical protein